jgi:hypothetical protein
MHVFSSISIYTRDVDIAFRAFDWVLSYGFLALFSSGQKQNDIPFRSALCTGAGCIKSD